MSSLEEAVQQLKKNGFLWVDFNDPTIEHLRPLIELFGIHPLSVEDCLDDNQIPKMDTFSNYSFHLFNHFTYKNQELCIEEIDILIGANFLISVHGHQAGGSDFSSKLDGFVAKQESEAARGPDYLMHVILDLVVDQKFEAIEQLQDEIDLAEETVINTPEKFKPQQLMHLRGCLVKLRKSLFYEREVLTKICRKDCPFISEKSIYYFRDVFDHLAKFFEFIEINREMIANLMELHLSLRSNQMALMSQQTNETVKRLTVITTIFMPLTLLSGIGGMSEWSMITGPENWKIAYPLFIVGMLVIGVLNYLLLKWSKWIDQ